MRFRAFCCLAAMVCSSASAGDLSTDTLQPALQVSWTFGQTGPEQPLRLSLGWYPNDLGWQRMWRDAGLNRATPPRPAVVELRWNGHPSVGLMGLPLDSALLWSSANAGERPNNWPLIFGSTLLALGATAALVVQQTENAVEDAVDDGSNSFFDNNQDDDDGEGDDNDGGILCINGVCVIPCGLSGPIGSCAGG